MSNLTPEFLTPSSSSPRRRARVACAAILVLLLAALAAPAATAETKRAFPVRVDLSDEQRDLKRLAEMKIDVDGVFRGWARIYVTQEELDKLTHIGFALTRLPDTAPAMARAAAEAAARRKGASQATERGGGVPAQYHTYATLDAELNALAAAHPSILQVIDIGLSVQGRKLKMVKITDNPGIEEDEPEFAYISSMHGDEVVGKEMLMGLINYLVDNYGSDARVTDLINETEIWMMPSMNPDGTELAQRYNANGSDLNRNFPDQFSDPINSGAGRQIETQAVMAWAAAHSTVLGANMHGGALVANYPFDSNPSDSSVFSPTPFPDHDAFVSISRTYADNNPPMSVSNSHAAFDDGITNGADWYSIRGGMQDWNYVWRGNLELTLELSNTKWPNASTLPGFWNDNQESLLAYIERVHDGLRGVVTDSATGLPVAASIRIDSNSFLGYTDPDVGDYYRLLMPGSYTVEVSAVGYETQTISNVIVPGGPATRLDVLLVPLPVNLVPESACADDGGQCDPYLTGGQTSDLALTLKNIGASGTNVSATIEPTGWYAGVIRAVAEYSDIATGASGQSLAPHHQVEVSPSVPGGHKLGFAVHWTADQGSGVSGPFFMDVGDVVCGTVVSTNVPLAIADFVPITSTLDVASLVEISEVKVMVDVSHTYIGDLRISLNSPGGGSLILHDRSGGSSNDIVGTYGQTLGPAQPLSILDGEPSNGTWELDIADNAGGDVGSLNAWSVEVCGRGFESATPEMRFRELTRGAGEVTLDWWPYPGLDSYKLYRSTDPSLAAAFLDATGEDGDATDTRFVDNSVDGLVFYIVTGVGPLGEGPKGHFGE